MLKAVDIEQYYTKDLRHKLVNSLTHSRVSILQTSASQKTNQKFKSNRNLNLNFFFFVSFKKVK